jgi:ketosteroid isomerase-like protein
VDRGSGHLTIQSDHFLFLFRAGAIYQAKQYDDSQHVAEIFGGGNGGLGK